MDLDMQISPAKTPIGKIRNVHKAIRLPVNCIKTGEFGRINLVARAGRAKKSRVKKMQQRSE